MQIKPIETVYKGYKFRSRLEARWAVYFDTLNLPWEYEKEGYDLGDGIWYLPDFWLPSVKMWAEVKARELNDSERVKCRRLAEQTNCVCLMLEGTPDRKAYWGIVPVSPFEAAMEVLASHITTAYWEIGKEHIGQMVVTAGRIKKVQQVFLPGVSPYAVVEMEDAPFRLMVGSQLFARTVPLWEDGAIILVDGKVLDGKGIGAELGLKCEGVMPYTSGSFGKENRWYECDYILANVHDYLQYEHRFFSSTGMPKGDLLDECYWNDVDPAINAARQARFEHRAPKAR